MSGFSATWLALREPADWAARDQGLARRFAAALPRNPTILDLGAGTGGNARALAPLIGDGARWRLLEIDPVLRARHDPRFESVVLDLAGGLGDLAADGVTASALLDLAGAAWLDGLAQWLARRRVPFLATLTVDGERTYRPADPEDARVGAAFFRDQGRHKGLGPGPALGPAASGMLAASLARRGFAVSTAASDWQIGADRPELLTELARGEAEAAGAAGGWEGRRLAQIAGGRLGARIGHRDLLALPGGT